MMDSGSPSPFLRTSDLRISILLMGMMMWHALAVSFARSPEMIALTTSASLF